VQRVRTVKLVGNVATTGKVVVTTSAGGVLMYWATDRFGRVLLALVVASIGLQSPVCSGAPITIVNETFDGYTSFPSQKPAGQDFVNLGVPMTSEGADSNLWMAARFGPGGDPNGAGSINADVGVQEIGSVIAGQNSSHVGRVGDTAGLVLRLDLTGLRDVTLDFDWRTYVAEEPDRFIVAYYKGDGTAFQPEGLGTPNNKYDWFNDPQLGNGSTTWYNTYWVELMQGAPNDLFTHETFSLPGDDIVYLAFRETGGDLDFGKFDNVVITARPIPEPSSLILFGLALAAIAGARRRR
jgi:hypothetical protein